MRTSLLAFMLIAGLILPAQRPGRFGAAAPAPPGAGSDDDDSWDDDDEVGDRQSDDEDRDAEDEEKGDDEDGQARTGPRGVENRGESLGPKGGVQGRGGLEITRGPYLQLSTPASVTIRWRTSQPTSSRVQYGGSPDRLELQKTETAASTEHEMQLTGLSPDTRYSYSIGTSSSVLAGGPDYAFRTAPPVGSNRAVRIWMIGDSGRSGEAQQRVRDAYDAYSGAASTDVWLLLGDNAYDSGTAPQYQAGFFQPYATRLRSTVVWPSRGNHDQTRAGPDNDYYDFFALPTAGEAGGTASGTEAYYSFDFANVHFVCLDAERLDGRMIEWLTADLAATDQDWVIAYWHHPPYSKGSHDSDGDGIMTQARRRFLPVLEAGGVDLVACGHSHAYERSFLLDGHYGSSASLSRSMILDRGDGRPDGSGPYRKPTFGRPAPHEGAVYVVVGSSSKLGGGRLDHPAHARSLNALGSLAVDVSGNRLEAAFVDDRGRVADRFAIVKGKDPVSSVDGRPGEADARRPGANTGGRTER